MFFRSCVRCQFFLICFAQLARAQPGVLFDQDEYLVSSVNETFVVKVLLDGDMSTPELEPIRGGLFSFGSSIEFNALKAKVEAVDAIEPAADLDFFGLTAAGLENASPGIAAAKGNIDQAADPLVPYADSLLLSVTLTNLADPIDQYPLSLDFFRTLGDTEQIFVTGTGDVLDGDLVFGTAVVRVVPEPSSRCLLLFASVLSMVAWRRCR